MSPATAMGTGSFRHGPREIVGRDVRFGMWIDGTKIREQDLAVACDLRKLGARVMLIGQRLPGDAGDLLLQILKIPSEWQFFDRYNSGAACCAAAGSAFGGGPGYVSALFVCGGG